MTDIASHPATTGADAQVQIAKMRAWLVARYKLTAAGAGKPEELVSTTDPNRGASLGYGCRTIRVRLMAGREWIRTDDFQIRDDWHTALNAMCDTYFDYREQDTTNRHVTGVSPLAMPKRPVN